MKITEFLQGIGSPIAFYPDLVPLTGSHHAAIFLCQLTYWHGKQSNPAGWIYKTQEEWQLETELTDKQQKNARELLVARGLIQERYSNWPRRLEYRLKENVFNKLWDCWQVACRIKQEFKDINSKYGILASFGFAPDDIKLKLENYRLGLQQCQQVAVKFFTECQVSGVNPITKLNEFERGLRKVAETLEKSIISHRGKQESRHRRNRNPGMGETGISDAEKQESPIAGSTNNPYRKTGIAYEEKQESPMPGSRNPAMGEPVESVIIDVQAFQVPTENTAENTAEISSKITGEITAKNMRPGISISGVPPLKNFEEEEPEFTVRGERGIEPPKETQKNPRPEEGYRAEPTNPHEGKYSAAAPNFEQTPDWVQEIEEKVRQGKPLQREKLIALANYRLGDSLRLYRRSGEIFNPALGDISEDFVKFVQWYSFNGDPNVAYVQACILKFEKQPENWTMLQTWVSEWQSVVENPGLFKEMMSNRVGSQGKKASGRDLDILNELALREAFGL